MRIRTKLKAFVAVFLILTGLSGAGSFLIFEGMSGTFEALRGSSRQHELLEDLKTSIAELVMATDAWVVTGDPIFRKTYGEKLSNIHKRFGDLSALAGGGEALNALGTSFEEMRSVAHEAITMEHPVGNQRMGPLLKRLGEKEGELRDRLDAVYLKSVKTYRDTIEGGEATERKMAYYFAALVVGSSLFFIFLAIFMGRVIADPFQEIMVATDRISSGELGYRIGSRRRDEFGVIAGHFDRMLNELQKVNEKNEELYLSTKVQLQNLAAMYEIAKTITSSLDLNEVLEKMAEQATELLHTKGCIIRLIEGDNLVIKASFGLPKEIEGMMTLSLGEGLPGKVAQEGRPVIIADMSGADSEWRVPYLDVKSVMNVPLKVGPTVIGTFALYDKMSNKGEIVSFSSDDLRIAEGFASLSAIAIDKAKMFELERQKEKEAVEAKKKLDVLFDSVQGGIISIAKDFTILSANSFVERWRGMTVEEMTGKSALEIFHNSGGICPHCVAQVTCETGEINTITQTSGLNYAELTSYPVRDENGAVAECVVYIQDVTDKVLYQEEMLALYREGIQTKEYLESLIENSADAIVTSDLFGNITSWNRGAEKIYGYRESEAVGKFLPFVPDFLTAREKEHLERVRNGEVLKDIETVRQRMDGTIIEVSLTLSPIKDASGEIIGISGISRDISDKKRVEKELIRRNQELSRLFFISSAMRSTLDLDRLLRMILTAVTMGEGLGFNRAVLFLVDEDKNVLKGAMGVGPSSIEEAASIWEKLHSEKKTLADVMEEIEKGSLRKDSFLDRLSMGMEIPLDSTSAFTLALREKKPLNIRDVKEDPLSDAIFIQQLGTEAYAVVPLISRDKVIGILWVDNLYTRRPVTDEDMQFLTAFSNQVAAAIESAKLFEKISLAEAELENIFRSISDMVFFTDTDYTIRNVNTAVARKFGMTERELIGRKCYEIFHGTDSPLPECPHHRTVETKKAFVEEVEDPHLGGIFLTSTSPLFDGAGNFLGTVHIVRDISEIKMIQEKLAMSERMAALGEVAARVAHEIRNPLVSIGGFAQRLEKTLEGNLKEYAVIINTEVKRLELILKEILGFVREVRLTRTEVNINDVINEVLALVESELDEKGIVMKTALGDVPGILLDADRVKEAVLNIVSNAIQAVGAKGEIQVRTSAANGHVIIEVSDTGTGIEEKDMAFIFDPFYTTKPMGTGLGLAITRRIIEEHKGRIEAKSRPGEGTIIRVFLPTGKEDA